MIMILTSLVYGDRKELKTCQSRDLPLFEVGSHCRVMVARRERPKLC